jgi:hypothetical protein
VSNLRPLPTDLRDHLSELTGNEFKIWTAYYLRTGDHDLTSHPSNETIGKDTGLTNRTVKTSKAGLRAKGWLAYTGDYKQPRSAEGVYAVPVMEVRLPWRPDWSAFVMDVNTAYDAFTTVVQKMTHGTVVQNLHPEGSIVFGLGLDFSSLSPSTIVRGAPHPLQEVGERKAKSKPENLKPTPEPKPTPTPAKVRRAPDGTPWPEGFDSWPKNADRLVWLEAHGHKVGGGKQDRNKAPSVADSSAARAWEGTPPLLDPPGSASPPSGGPRPNPYANDPKRCRNGCSSRTYPVYKDKLCRSCYEEEPWPDSIETTALDNWEEL